MDSMPGDTSLDQVSSAETTTKNAAKTSLTFWLVASTMIATLCGSFQIGYQIAGFTAPSVLMQTFYNQSNEERRDEFLNDTALLWLWSTTVSIVSVGAAIGGLVSGYLADRLGRKGTMLMINVFSISGGLLMGLSYVVNTFEIIILGRLVIGFYIGVSCGVIPLYISEIAPVGLRGAVGIAHQVMITVGVLVVQILGIYVFMYEMGWPVLISLSSMLSVIQLCVLPFCPESPRWLFIKKHKEAECRQVLEKLRGTDDVDDEIAEIGREAKDDDTGNIGVLNLLRLQDPNWKKPLIISFYLLFAQQFSGVSAIIFYATEIYRQTGMDDAQVAYSLVGTGAIFVISAILAVFLVDRIGRKPLLVYPYAVMTVALGITSLALNLQANSDVWKWVALVCIYIFIIAIGIGPGPVPYVLVPEIWAQGPRSAAMAIAIQTLWTSTFIVGITFPYLQDKLGAYTFVVYAFICCMSTLFMYFYVPETKGRTYEDIVKGFHRKRVIEEETKEYLEMVSNNQTQNSMSI